MLLALGYISKAPRHVQLLGKRVQGLTVQYAESTLGQPLRDKTHLDI